MMNLWNNFICFINANSALWSFLVTVATIVYVILTYKLLKETQKARLDSIQPYVIVDFYYKKTFLYMTVKNFGNDSAFDIEIEVSPKIKISLNKIAFLAPEKQITQNLLMPYSREDEVDITIKLQYKSSRNKTFQHSYIQHLYNQKENWFVQDTNVSDSLNELTKTANTLSANIKTLSEKIKK